MTEDLEEFERLLRKRQVPAADEGARERAISNAMQAFDKKYAHARQGIPLRSRLMDAVRTIHNAVMGRDFMKKGYIVAGLSAIALALVHHTYFVGIPPLQDRSEPPAMTHKEAVAAENTGTNNLTVQPSSLPVPSQSLASQMGAKQLSKDSAGADELKNSDDKNVAVAGAVNMEVLPVEKSIAGKMGTTDSVLTSVPNGRAYGMPVYPQPVYQNEGHDKFDHFTPNPVKAVKQEPVSTFSIDVDTSSYSFLRATLNSGSMPQPDAVRIEELVNYFPYDYAVPENKEAPFKVLASVFPTPWSHDTKLLRIGIKGYEMSQKEKPHSNLVFLLDTSGSMNDPVRLPLVVNSLKLLLDSLRPDDTVAIVTYAGYAGVALEPTPVKEKEKIVAVLNGLYASGSTAGFDGLQTAYKLAERNFDPKSVNRVILSTDGDFNVGITDQNQLKDFVSHEKDKGIFLSVLGVGMGNYNDAVMQALAQNGNGVAAYIDNLNEGRKVLVEEAGSTLFTIAKDVKIQVEFNPAQVAEYRLVGYESRMLNREDFNNDKVDAGDVGAGHAVTALYEITPVGSKLRRVDDLRYQHPAPAEEEKDFGNGEYAFVKIRYKLPSSDTSKLISTPVDSHNEAREIAQAPNDARFAAAVAAFGQLLKGDGNLGSFSYDDVIALAKGARGDDASGYRAEFIHLVELAKHAAGIPAQQGAE